MAHGVVHQLNTETIRFFYFFCQFSGHFTASFCVLSSVFLSFFIFNLRIETDMYDVLWCPRPHRKCLFDFFHPFFSASQKKRIYHYTRPLPKNRFRFRIHFSKKPENPKTAHLSIFLFLTSWTNHYLFNKRSVYTHQKSPFFASYILTLYVINQSHREFLHSPFMTSPTKHIEYPSILATYPYPYLQSDKSNCFMYCIFDENGSYDVFYFGSIRMF